MSQHPLPHPLQSHPTPMPHMPPMHYSHHPSHSPQMAFNPHHPHLMGDPRGPHPMGALLPLPSPSSPIPPPGLSAPVHIPVASPAATTGQHHRAGSARLPTPSSTNSAPPRRKSAPQPRYSPATSALSSLVCDPSMDRKLSKPSTVIAAHLLEASNQKPVRVRWNEWYARADGLLLASDCPRERR
jgi:hypothetical protein